MVNYMKHDLFDFPIPTTVCLDLFDEDMFGAKQGIFVGLWVPSILALGGYFNG